MRLLRFALAVAIVTAAALLPAGCGSSDEPHHGMMTGPAGATAGTCGGGMMNGAHMRVTGASCQAGRVLMAGWRHRRSCRPGGGASRSGCTLRHYRCMATASGRGYSVSCSMPGRSVAFTAPRP